MGIKVAIIENDNDYKERLANGFLERYAEMIELYTYSSLDQLKEKENVQANIYMISSEYEFDRKELQFPNNSIVVYLVDTKDVESYKGEKAIVKYQSLENLYRRILDLYTDISGVVVREQRTEGSANIFVFTSGRGGVGKTTLAISAAYNLARSGKSVLYIPFEAFGNTDMYFTRNPERDMGNIIYDIKSKRENIAQRITSCIQKNEEKVSYISSPDISYNITDMKKEELEVLLKEVATLKYDNVIVDVDLGIGKLIGEISNFATRIIYVTENTRVAMEKEKNYISAMRMLEKKNEYKIVDKMIVIVNKYIQGGNCRRDGMDLSCEGIIDNVVHSENLIKELANQRVISRVLNVSGEANNV